MMSSMYAQYDFLIIHYFSLQCVYHVFEFIQNLRALRFFLVAFAHKRFGGYCNITHCCKSLHKTTAKFSSNPRISFLRKSTRKRIPHVKNDQNKATPVHIYICYRPLSRRLDRCDRVIQNEGNDSRKWFTLNIALCR